MSGVSDDFSLFEECYAARSQIKTDEEEEAHSEECKKNAVRKVFNAPTVAQTTIPTATPTEPHTKQPHL